MQRQDYKETFAISQSAIKAFRDKGILKFKKIYVDKLEDDDEDQDKFAFGSLVDTLAFQSHLLNERFYISDNDVPIPGEKVKLIADRTYKEALEIIENKQKLNEQGNLPEPLWIPNISNIYDWNDVILKHARGIKYGGNSWSNSRILDTVFQDSELYFRMLGEANGRSVINGFDNADAIEMVEALRNNKNTHPYFVQQEGELLLFQQEIFLDCNVNGIPIPLKGALDIVRINHNDKTICVPDLKTTFDSLGFPKIAKQFGYVIQASFYNFLVKEWLKTFHGGKYVDYQFQAPMNIVIDRDLKAPYIYEYDWDDIDAAERGSKERNFIGWRQTLEEIAWHLQSGVWNMPKEMYETGKIKLKIFQ
jgi:hypothetical protein